MSIKKVVFIFALSMLLIGCDSQYDANHAVNRERCLQSIADGSAYEVDDSLTVSAPWEVGEIVIKWLDGDGEIFYRKFIGITKAGYYLVQDFSTYDYRQEQINRYGYEVSTTKPYALMSRDEVKRAPSYIDVQSACGSYVRTYHRIKDEGVFLDGVKEGEWRHYSAGNITKLANYKDGVRDGLFIDYWNFTHQVAFFSYYTNGNLIFPSFSFYENGRLRFVSIAQGEQKSMFMEFDERGHRIQQGYWENGKKVGIWSKWDSRGQLIEEIHYD